MLISVGGAAMAACGGWFGWRNDDLPTWSAGLMGVSLLIALAGTVASLRRHPVGLRCDSQSWYLCEPSRRAQEVGPAQLQVLIDAGPWLLLKFMPEGRPSWLSACWLPVQRRGMEDQWHALRCAVYSPRSGVTRLIGLAGPTRIE